MKVSYVVPCWVNDEETLQIVKNAIHSFKEATPNEEIIIVDNDSTVGGGWMRSESTLYIRLSPNQGYTPAIRYGLLCASGGIIGIMNDDIRIAPNWYDVVYPILQDENVATVHPRMTDYDVPFAYGGNTVVTGKERWCQNSCVFTTRAFLDRLEDLERQEGWEPYPGMFDLGYGVGGGYDDWDFYHRVRSKGFNTVYTDKTCFQHLHSWSLKKLGDERQRIVESNRKHFIKKHGLPAEEIFEAQFPEQMKQDYKGGFDL